MLGPTSKTASSVDGAAISATTLSTVAVRCSALAAGSEGAPPWAAASSSITCSSSDWKLRVMGLWTTGGGEEV
jgi:hypothetical protein